MTTQPSQTPLQNPAQHAAAAAAALLNQKPSHAATNIGPRNRPCALQQAIKQLLVLTDSWLNTMCCGRLHQYTSLRL
jgi:hypothetical protein